MPSLHLLLCLVVRLHPNDWQWFPVFMMDLPISILLEQLNPFFTPFAVYAILGTLWWYLLGCAVKLLLG